MQHLPISFPWFISSLALTRRSKYLAQFQDPSTRVPGSGEDIKGSAEENGAIKGIGTVHVLARDF